MIPLLWCQQWWQHHSHYLNRSSIKIGSVVTDWQPLYFPTPMIIYKTVHCVQPKTRYHISYICYIFHGHLWETKVHVLWLGEYMQSSVKRTSKHGILWIDFEWYEHVLRRFQHHENIYFRTVHWFITFTGTQQTSSLIPGVLYVSDRFHFVNGCYS